MKNYVKDMSNEERVKKIMPFILAIYVIAGLEEGAFTILSPTLTEVFQVSASMIALHFSICGVAYAIAAAIYGTVSDFMSIKKIMLFAVVLFVGGALMGIAFQFNFYLFIFARTLTNIGHAGMSAAYVVLVAKYLKGNTKIKYFAIFTACFQLTQAVGVLAGGLIATYLTWWMVFLVSLVMLLFVPALIRYLPQEQSAEKSHLDVAGLVLFAGLVLCVNMYFGNMEVLWIVAAVLFLLAFAAYITKNKSAFVTSEFFKNRNLIIVLVMEFLLYVVQIPFSFLYSFIVSGIYGQSEAVVSYVMLPAYLIAALVGTMFANRLIKKFGKFRILSFAMCLIFAALVLTGTFLDSSLIVLSVTSVMFSMGYVLMYSPVVDTVFSTLDKEHVGRGQSFNGLMLDVSASIGIVLAGQLMGSQFINGVKVPFIKSEGAGTYSVIMYLMAGVFLIGMLIYHFNKKKFVNIQEKEERNTL